MAKQLNLTGEGDAIAKRKARAKKTKATMKRNLTAKKDAAWGMWAAKARAFGADLRIISVDPAHSCGMALLAGGKLRTRTLHDADPRTVLNIMRRIATPTTVGILEDQFVGRAGNVSKIIERRAMIQTVLRLLGVQCITVLPGVWQSEMLGKPPPKPAGEKAGYRTRWLKAKSMQVAAPWDPPNDDEADAGNLARWANEKIGMPPIKGERDR